jgi:hypothetical protein
MDERTKKMQKRVQKASNTSRRVERVGDVSKTIKSINSRVDKVNSFYVKDNIVINPKTYSATGASSNTHSIYTAK